MKLFYLIGEPGAGKSTLLARLKDEGGLVPQDVARPFAHVLWYGEESRCAAELGPRRASFGGTDGLSMSVQPKVVDWLELGPHSHIFGEGDRLANGKFFAAVTALGYDLTVALLAIPPELAAQRRARRAAELGTKSQDPKWVEGRRTKVLRLADDWATLTLSAAHSVEQNLDTLRAQPVFRHVLGGAA